MQPLRTRQIAGREGTDISTDLTFEAEKDGIPRPNQPCKNFWGLLLVGHLDPKKTAVQIR